MTTAHTPRSEFLNGARDTLPMVVGAIPFGIIFGVVASAPTQGGLSIMATLAMSLFVFAGSSQFIGAQLFGTGAPVLVIVLTTFVVNLRHALYSITLGPHVKHLSQRWLLPLAFWLTDETFAVVVNRYNQADDSPHKHWYQLGSSVLMYTNWFACTLVGVAVGSALPDARALGLDFAMVVTFIGIVVGNLKTRPLVLAAVVAGAVALLTNTFDHKLGLLVAALAGVAAGVWAESVTAPALAVPPVQDAVSEAQS
jgi:4-azaleucine resistance transporter AzlC